MRIKAPLTSSDFQKAYALTTACAGDEVANLYRLVTADLPLESRKIVQRRIKEAILKDSILVGVPRAAQAQGPLLRAIPEDEGDVYSPRTEKAESRDCERERAEKAARYIGVLWGGAEAAQQVRERLAKNYPDYCQ